MGDNRFNRGKGCDGSVTAVQFYHGRLTRRCGQRDQLGWWRRTYSCRRDGTTRRRRCKAWTPCFPFC